MIFKNTVETLTHTAVTAVRHPFGTAVKATGLVRDTAGVGIGLVRGRIGGAPTQAPAPAEEIVDDVQETAQEVVADVKDTAVDVKEKVKDTAAEVTEEVSDTAADVQAKVAETAGDVQAKAEKVAPARKAPAAKKAPAGKKAPATEKTPAKKAPAQKAPVADPRDEIPGPDLAPYLPPAPEDLPEPIVIEAE
jgi:heparin binding hemagglutinin HbhA